MSNNAVSLQNVSYVYPDGYHALTEVSFTVERGERVGVVGANGAGKSTLLLALAGVLRPSGTVEVDGVKVDGKNLKQARRRMGLVFQNPDDQLFCPTLYDDVAFGPLNMGMPEHEARHKTLNSIKSVGLAGLEEKSAFHLSYGQKKRAAIATVLSMDVSILAMDEPTSNLDPKSRKEIIHLLKGLERTQIIATHDFGLVNELCGRVALLSGGRIAAEGAPAEILDDHGLLKAHGLE
ncbi:MAG: ABC transporter ATP-binding protein [Nitrospinae bacterium]|nr:ABC transporter ATP-binding protein [Nitrospinota bacterium]